MGIAAVEGVEMKHVRGGDWTIAPGLDNLRDCREISGPTDRAVAPDEFVDFLTLRAYDSLE